MSIRINWRARLMASAVHFLVTLLLAGCASALIFFVWFPGAFARMVGGTQLFFLVVCSDLVLGPLMSLVIFNTKKSRLELVIDYLIVGIIQVGAMVYGLSVVAESRPVFIAFTKDRYEVVAALQLSKKDLAAAVDSQYKSRSWTGPVMVAIKFPTDLREANALLFSTIAGKGAQLMPKYYRPYASMIDKIKAKCKPLRDLLRRHPDKREELEKAVKSTGRSAKDLVWLPVHDRFGFWTVLIDANTGYPVKYLPIDPY